MAESFSKINQTVPLLINTLMNHKQKSDSSNLDFNKMISSQIDSYLKRQHSRSDEEEPKWMEIETNVNKPDSIDVTNSFSNYGDQGFEDYQSFMIPTPEFSNDDDFKNQFDNTSDLGFSDEHYDTFNNNKSDHKVYDWYEPKDGSSWDDQDKWSNNGDENKATMKQFLSSFYKNTNYNYLDDTNLAEHSPDKSEDNFETTEHDEVDGYEDGHTGKRKVNTYDPYDPESLSKLKLFDSNRDYYDNKNYDYDENEAHYLPESPYKSHQGHYQNNQYQDDNFIDEFPDYQEPPIFQAGQLNHNQNLNEQTPTNEPEENEVNEENEQNEANEQIEQNKNNLNRLNYKLRDSNNLMLVPNLSYLLRPKIKYVDKQKEKRLEHQNYQMNNDLIEKRETSIKNVGVTSYTPDLNGYSQIDYTKIPGQPIKDYPTYSEVPKNAESLCKDKYPGYYANPNYRCQVYHYCNYLMTHTFLCSNGTVFDQNLKVCDWWFNVDCSGRVHNATSFDF